VSDDQSPPPKATKATTDGFDVVWLHGKTPDGEGANVLRLRPGRLEAGEVRPMKEGRPIHRGGQVVKLAARPEAGRLYDVEVQYEAPSERRESDVAASAAAAVSGPPQVASSRYRESWERTFGAAARKNALN
jgi:hypothetical protein